eukprot:CAMPEP_0196135962 /NCGR_PEP_ID=MMETSP0910-20130528/4426_1 /TAXON_ID=49265 /ORGANISM="Thalassiosira rotula, Strain GSO102" /LENGTH=200 /DNA_ID=CAMNT_0041396171 /DNA_START=78 /DNA_END=680 /DNA_ORIENTATION=+
MLTTRFFKCLCSIGQIATAVILLTHAPQQSLAFAPSLNHPATTATTSRHGISRQLSVTPPTTTTTTTTTSSSSTSKTSLPMSENQNETKSSLPVLLDPGTKGGAVFLSLVLFIVPIIGYNIAVGVFGVDEIEAGRDIGVGFTVFTMILWGASYIFRVATKDMTYAKQLKDYEDAVIAKRLEELDEDEVQALVEEIDRDQF